MARHPSTTRLLRLLALAIVSLQLGAGAAIAQGHQAPEPVGLAQHQDPPDGRVTAQDARSPALPVATADLLPPSTTVPAPVPPTPTPTPTTTEPAHPAPPPAPPPPPPAPAPAPPAPSPPPPPSPAARVQAAFEASVPAAWRGAIPVRLRIIAGSTSWAWPDGTIEVGTVHANGSAALLRATLAHEFGHLMAFRYGSQAYNGAAPDGWPASSDRPEEAWADCVSRALTGIDDPSHGLPPCTGSSLSFTSAWTGAGPDAHPRTGG